MSIAVMETSGSHLEIVDERIAKGNLVDGGGVPQVTMVNCLSVEVKLRGYIAILRSINELTLLIKKR
jgi:hypothetical protein